MNDDTRPPTTEAQLPLSEEPLSRESKGPASPSLEAALRLGEQVSEAKLAHEAIIAQAPASVAAHCRLGEMHLLLGDPAAARSSFLAAAAADETSPQAHVGLGRVADRLGERDEAIAHFERALALRPGLDAVAATLDRLRTSLPAARTDGNRVPGDFASQFKFANELMERRRYGDAEEIYRELLVHRPTSPALLYKLGTALVEIGKIDEASDYYARAISADPEYVWSYVGQADLFEAQGQLASAVEALEIARRLRPDLQFLPRRLAGLRRRMETQSTPDGPPIVVWPSTVPAATTPDEAPRRRVAVVAWDLSHNAVGRAWALGEMAARNFDCELVGPIFPTYGDDLWQPLRDTHRPIEIRGFRALSFVDFLNGAIRLVEQRPCDVAFVSKPRFPSLLIGFLYKLIHGARLVLDIDDDELAFVGTSEALDTTSFIAGATPSDWKAPHGKHWTQLAASLIDAADARTVCNPVLQKRFGGTIVRHARDEQLFAAAAVERESLRREFGFADSDKVVLFLGTPRRHKGLLEIADALRTLADPDTVLCVVGTITDEQLKRDLLATAPARISLHSDQPFHRLAALNAMADVVCVLQDPASRISLSQTPAKLTDALATGTPVIATALPPIADLIGPGRITAIDTASGEPSLVDLLRTVLNQDEPGATDARRTLFQQELSTTANAARVRDVVNGVLGQDATPMPEGFGRLLQHIDAEMPGRPDDRWFHHLSEFLDPRPRIGPLRQLDRDLNVVLFWKQNDSGLYGRRPDMLVQELSRLPAVRRVLQIDAPICVDQLIELGSDTDSQGVGQGRLIAAQIVKRFLEADDWGGVYRRTFVYRGDTTHLLGRELPHEAAFPNAVERWLTTLGMTENTLAWVCPVIPAFPEIQARLRFPFVLSDVIDDQRQWPMPRLRRARVEKSYRDTFAVTDVATANCDVVTKWLGEEGLPVRLVPNGMETHADVASWPSPPEFSSLARPIIGYSGSLTHRFDWPLIDAIAKARPDWTIVLIGAMPDSAAARMATSRPNVHPLGVIPYERALRYIASFDVAIVPHLRTSLSERMNPLKLYVYRSLGVPVVSTPVPNIQDFANDIRVAMPENFVAEIDAAVADRKNLGRMFPDAALLRSCTWETRMHEIMEHARGVLEAKLSASRSGGPDRGEDRIATDDVTAISDV